MDSLVTWSASAPANIALIKYMGKLDTSKNLPLNASLSYTLDHCRTFVDVEINHDKIDHWLPLEMANAPAMQLSEQGTSRFLQHLHFLKNHFDCQENFTIKSANNFPADCGLASSASSYAALTKAVCFAIADLKQSPALSISDMAHLSQLGSGSSCRSFYSPWCIWQENSVAPVALPYENLLHQIVVVDHEKKSVSSSEAHKRVQTSPLYEGRKSRAETRLTNLLAALTAQDWKMAFTICWEEFWDMHTLFETSAIPFGYMTLHSGVVLAQVRELWQQHKDGPLATMDAGPNVHLLFREDQIHLANQFESQLPSNYNLIKNYS